LRLYPSSMVIGKIPTLASVLVPGRGGLGEKGQQMNQSIGIDSLTHVSTGGFQLSLGDQFLDPLKFFSIELYPLRWKRVLPPYVMAPCKFAVHDDSDGGRCWVPDWVGSLEICRVTPRWLPLDLSVSEWEKSF
jgi:hypothetical protein